MLRFLMLVSLLGLGSGCAMTGVNLTHGPALITVYKDSGGLGHPTKHKKTGKACSYNILGFLAVGDGSIQAAKTRGGVAVVSHFDKHLYNFLLFGKACTVVYGS